MYFAYMPAFDRWTLSVISPETAFSSVTHCRTLTLLWCTVIIFSTSWSDQSLDRGGRLENMRFVVTDGDTIQADIPPHAVPKPRLIAEEPDTISSPVQSVDSAPLVIAGDTLFFIYQGLGVFSAKERADKTKEKIEILINNPAYANVPITLSENVGMTAVMAGDMAIVVVSNQDAMFIGGLRQEIATMRAQIIRQIVERERARRNPRAMLLATLFTLAATVALFTFWRLMTLLSRRQKDRLAGRHVLQFGSTQDVSTALDHRSDRIIITIKSIRVLAQLALLYGYVTFVSGFFYVTQGLHVSLNRQLRGVANWAGPKFVNFLPKLFIIATILSVTYIVLQMIRLLFVGVARETIRWPGFRPEWAHPTYRIVSIFVGLLAFVLLWPHLPGSNSPALIGMAIVLGAIFILGSVAMSANWISGMLIGYALPFRTGERIRAAGVTGIVIGWTLLATRIRTDKNTEVTIPNAIVLAGNIVNYSRPGSRRNLILSTTITLGYEIPWMRAHELLVAAALRTSGVIKDPLPFVIQKSLNPEVIIYELNVHTAEPHLVNKTRSDLHQHILDVFHEVNIPIHSTSYGQDDILSDEIEMEEDLPQTPHLPFRVFPAFSRMFRRERPLPPESEKIPE